MTNRKVRGPRYKVVYKWGAEHKKMDPIKLAETSSMELAEHYIKEHKGIHSYLPIYRFDYMVYKQTAVKKKWNLLPTPTITV